MLIFLDFACSMPIISGVGRIFGEGLRLLCSENAFFCIVHSVAGFLEASDLYPTEHGRCLWRHLHNGIHILEGLDLMSNLCKNVFEAILKYGHDEDFDPVVDFKFLPTDAPAGSQEKIDVLRKRVELGQPLWHNDDRVDYSGLTGAIRPRE